MKRQTKHLEMGYTAPEFKKTLQGQFTQTSIFTISKINNQEWLIRFKSNASIKIKIAEGKARQIGMLNLPVLNTSFEFKNMSAHQEKDFMSLFFRYFHKGGG